MTPAAGFPAAAIFPFTDANAEGDWEQEYADGHSPWISDPEAVSEAWVQNYLEQHDVTKLIDKHQTAATADVTMGRDIAEAGAQPVVVVHLVKFRNAWLVTGASSPHDLLTISSPTAGETVDSPLTVTGPGSILRGRDLRADLNARRFQLSKVTGHYAPKTR